MNPSITLDELITWLRRQDQSKIVDVESYCCERFNSRSVRVHPKEISVSFRFAWTDLYTPDQGLASLIEKRFHPMPAGELLALAELEASMPAIDHIQSTIESLRSQMEAATDSIIADYDRKMDQVVEEAHVSFPDLEEAERLKKATRHAA